jgi:hypothetical protein
MKTTEPFWTDSGDKRWIMVSSLIKVRNIDELRVDPGESQNYRWIKPDDPVVETSVGMNLSFTKLGIIV